MSRVGGTATTTATADVSMPADWAWLIVSPTAAEAGPDVLIIRPHRLAFLFGVQGKVLASLATTMLFWSPWSSRTPLPGSP